MIKHEAMPELPSGIAQDIGDFVFRCMVTWLIEHNVRCSDEGVSRGTMQLNKADWQSLLDAVKQEGE